MPRCARLDLPGVPTHVTQRGINHGAVFIDNHDRAQYRHLLAQALAESGVDLHAYALMGNHVHLLLTAPVVGALSTTMRSVGQSYTVGFNRRHDRSGPLWQGRFKSCLVDTERYVLMVCRYIDLNPVRAGLAATPAAYAWSSARCHLGLVLDPLLTSHPAWLALADDADERWARYACFLAEAVETSELDAIRRHLAQQRALGGRRFQAMVAQTLGREVRCRPPGRPRMIATAPAAMGLTTSVPDWELTTSVPV